MKPSRTLLAKPAIVVQVKHSARRLPEPLPENKWPRRKAALKAKAKRGRK